MTKKQVLIMKASDIIIRYEKLQKDTKSLPSLKKLAARALSKDLYEIKKQLEEIEEEENEQN